MKVPPGGGSQSHGRWKKDREKAFLATQSTAIKIAATAPPDTVTTKTVPTNFQSPPLGSRTTPPHPIDSQ